MTSVEQPVEQQPARRGERVSSRAVRALAAVHRVAEAGWATTAVGSWAFFQASVVPGPVDGVLVPLGLADPRRAFRFAWAALIGSTLGALAAYGLGAAAFEGLGRVILGWAGIDATEVEQFRGLFRQQGLWLVLLSTITPLSGKLVAIAAGAFGVPVIPFVLTVIGGRALRYGVVAAVVRYFGDRVETFIERRYGKTLDDIAQEHRRRRR